MMKSTKSVHCYLCNQVATTTEHIPPKCFFPESKYLSKSLPDYRNNLITVRACSKHNNSRSKDDEYTAIAIAMSSQSDIAFSLFKAKWTRTLLRREGVLAKKMFSTARNVRFIDNRNNLLIPYETLALSYNKKRVEGVIESIACALYYIEFGYTEKWTKSCMIKTLNFLEKDLRKPNDFYEVNRANQNFTYGEKQQEPGVQKKGANPDVFFYQFISLENGNSIIRMVFYNDVTFLAFLNKEYSK